MAQENIKDIKIEQKTKVKENKKDKIIDKKEEHKKEELKKVYLVDYYIKDLTLDKFLETNLPDKITPNVNDKVVIFKGKKPILEGMGDIFPKVEETIKSLKDGEEKTLKLSPIDAYGLRNKELLRVVSKNVFKENKINPFVGLTFETEGAYGVVKSVSGGRVLVDFNSPYADHDIEVYIKKIKTCNEKETIETILETFFPKVEAKLKSFENSKITIEMKLLEGQTKEMYQKIFDGFFKNFIKYNKIEIIEKNKKEQ